jgi:hypothetical protein
MTQNLTDFFREKKVRADNEARGIDWAQRRSDWLAAIKSLYSQIEQFLAEPIQQGSISIGRLPRLIDESHLGKYPVEDLVVTVGDEKVVFAPKARNVVGAQGRVDVRGEAGEASLVLQPGPRWAVVASRQPQLRLVEFNSENLAELFQAVMRQ